MKTQRERAEQRRRELLALIRDQVAEGSLTIRKMTPQERAEHPPRPSRAGSRRR